MIRTILLLSFILMGTLGFAQKSPDPYQIQMRVFETSKQNNDLAVATQALYTMMALQPENLALEDSLARIYFLRGAWDQCVRVSSKVLEREPGNATLLELRAIAYQSLGYLKESLADYETLFGQTKGPFQLYEICRLQYTMRRFGECEASVRQLLADPEIKDMKVLINAGQGSQEVPLAAAAYNLWGALDNDQGKKTAAKEKFEAAIKIFPEFTLAQRNLEELSKQ